ncbi:hypothetical protein HYU19_06185 [Candidatus Woesearchaeota archaeon]|nr:hypothetical protein [Candidatus Woesearchaeota archaeon]
MRHGTQEKFRQTELDWIVSESMKKKIFALLLNRGWLKKQSREHYTCIGPVEAIKGLLDFRVPAIIQQAARDYAFTGASAVEIWSDFSYVQRGKEKSPYFMKIAKKDVKYWKVFFNSKEIPHYTGAGMTVGEYVILMPVAKLSFVKKEGLKVDALKDTIRYAISNDTYSYALEYMKRKYK